MNLSTIRVYLRHSFVVPKRFFASKTIPKRSFAIFDECANNRKCPEKYMGITQKYLKADVDGDVDEKELKRLYILSKSFVKFTVVVNNWLRFTDEMPEKMNARLVKEMELMDLFLFHRHQPIGCQKGQKSDRNRELYSVPKKLAARFRDLEIAPVNWDAAMIKELDQLSNEEMRMFVDIKQSAGLLENEAKTFFGRKGNEIAKRELIELVRRRNSIEFRNLYLTGAYLLEHGTRSALIFLSWLGLNVLPTIKRTHLSKNENGEEKILYDLKFGKWVKPASVAETADTLKKLNEILTGHSELERKIGYQFQDRYLLLQAVTHYTFSANDITPTSQRLEFLGDAVLGYVIIRYLIDHPSQFDPQVIKGIRNCLTGNKGFACALVRCGLNEYLRHMDKDAKLHIRRFACRQARNKFKIDKESYIVEEKNDHVICYRPPSELGDFFEAIIGAVFIDSNFSLDAVWRVYCRLMRPELEYYCNNQPINPITELSDMFKNKRITYSKPENIPGSRLISVTVEIDRKTKFHGWSYEYKLAKWAAARCALNSLRNNNNCTIK